MVGRGIGEGEVAFMMVCPKCGFEQRPEEAAAVVRCPGCGAPLADASPDPEASPERSPNAEPSSRGSARRIGLCKVIAATLAGFVVLGALVLYDTDWPPRLRVREIGSGTTASGHDFRLYALPTGRVAAYFTPMLPQDDLSRNLAVMDVIVAAWGRDALTSFEPRVQDVSGVSVWEYDGADGRYKVLMLKENGGEVHTAIVWKD